MRLLSFSLGLALAALAACATVDPQPAADVGVTDDTRAVVARYWAAAQAGDAAAAAALFAPDARYADVTFDFAITGVPAIRAMLTQAFAMLDPVERRIVRQVFDGDQAVLEWEASGVHAAPALGVPATGRRLTIRAVSLIIVRSGRISSVTDYTDRAGLEAQLRSGG